MYEGNIEANQRNGNLHINLDGHFSAEVAFELTSTIAKSYNGKGNIFVHTAKVTTIAPESRTTLSDQITMLGLPAEKMYMTGVKGLDISPDKGKVIVYEKRKKGCCGKCKNCSCHSKR
ncbi:hypothetical protein JWJ90_07525 [Desulfobulbus rhabdoformis]|jgi:hypothetical protein|uniref:hypothetical protein n=1 Tax=Desulfobulbus rhabdoformis TaxID=34032 RepID=UPI0019641852|nr:hypothetical protein [Desulfobulbus rhabdoformis]MBM9614136.1 hypothetical protein [Desulfobulbus rhabdoformis]